MWKLSSFLQIQDIVLRPLGESWWLIFNITHLIQICIKCNWQLCLSRENIIILKMNLPIYSSFSYFFLLFLFILEWASDVSEEIIENCLARQSRDHSEKTYSRKNLENPQRLRGEALFSSSANNNQHWILYTDLHTDKIGCQLIRERWSLSKNSDATFLSQNVLSFSSKTFRKFSSASPLYLTLFKYNLFI